MQGREISALLVQHDINTEAFGYCASACVKIFLGSKSRILIAGAALGFHRPWLYKEIEKRFYEAHRISKGWEDEFDYVAWIYDVAFGDVLVGIKFMRSRHLAMTFILNIYSTDSNYMWKPTREELLAAGVITG